MKDIKDYLHLYLNCEIGIQEGEDVGIYKLVGVTESEPEPGIIVVILDDFHEEYAANVKLILRPLSDMTEEDRIELIRLNHPESTHPIISGVLYDDSHISFNAKDKRMKYAVNFAIYYDRLNPIEFIWFLSKGFDLFGLIEEGLAIKTGG